MPLEIRNFQTIRFTELSKRRLQLSAAGVSGEFLLRICVSCLRGGRLSVKFSQ
jgi:hypothetical protein